MVVITPPNSPQSTESALSDIKTFDGFDRFDLIEDVYAIDTEKLSTEIISDFIDRDASIRPDESTWFNYLYQLFYTYMIGMFTVVAELKRNIQALVKENATLTARLAARDATIQDLEACHTRLQKRNLDQQKCEARLLCKIRDLEEYFKKKQQEVRAEMTARRVVNRPGKAFFGESLEEKLLRGPTLRYDTTIAEAERALADGAELDFGWVSDDDIHEHRYRLRHASR
tara:strand:- start:3480 stop:4163 length:684 start_codon:yes stop_codon:yes gene_type:complete